MTLFLRGQVWKPVWIMTFFGLKLGKNLDHQRLPGVAPPRDYRSGAPNDNFWEISVRKSIGDFSAHLL